MNFFNIIIALFVFGIVVAIHELGHFSVAKLNKVTVHEFAIGMGPSVLQKKINETKYSLRMIPMGGFVSMEGENDESEDPNAFCRKTPLQRMAIIFAGPFMNFVLTVFILILLYSLNGIPVNKVGMIAPNSPLSKVDVQIGDEIIEIDGIGISSWNEIPETIQKTSGEINIKIKRNDEILSFDLVPQEKSGVKIIGLQPKYEKSFTGAVSYGFTQTLNIAVQMLKFVAKVFSGKVDINYISGPVGIVKEVGNSVNYGLIVVLNYIAFISLNLGIMNLLPIPALDGFRLLTSFSELVTGKKLNKKMEYTVNFLGMVFLIIIMLLVTYLDVLKIFSER